MPTVSDLPKASMLTITDGSTCVGFVLSSARGFRAFDRNCKPLGTFPDQRAAVLAIPRTEEPAR